MKEIANYDYCQESIKLKQNLESSFLILGEHLSKIRDQRLFMPSWESFEDFLVEADISPATASKLINIFQRFHVKFGFPVETLVLAGGWSKLSPLLPICNTREQAEEWIHKSQVLTRPDLEKELKEFRTGKDMRHCQHLNSYQISVCRDCGEKHRVYEEEKE